jgi:hypothetical protein
LVNWRGRNGQSLLHIPIGKVNNRREEEEKEEEKENKKKKIAE